LTSARFKELAGKIDTVIIPVGSLEAHGMHCPLGTDNSIPERLCSDLEAKIGAEVLIAPALNYGYTPSLTAFAGTVSIPAETLLSFYSELGTSFIRMGAKHIVFMNGHGGNIPMLTIACDRVAKAGGYALAISWWTTFSADILKICNTQGHAGEDETSLILAIDASLIDDSKRSVHMQKSFCIPLSGPDMVEHRLPEAMNGDSRAASVEKGVDMFQMILKKNLEFIRRLREKDFTNPIV
jgi:creatinine amidohydrolase